MSENKPIPSHKSYKEMSEYWDNHSLGDVWDQTEPVDFYISKPLNHRFLISVEGDVLDDVRQLAQTHGVSTDNMVNTLLKQQLQSILSK